MDGEYNFPECTHNQVIEVDALTDEIVVEKHKWD